MSTRTLIGSTEPDRRGYTARWLHYGDSPARLVPILRQIWTGTFGSSEPHLIEALLAHDWSELSADARDGHRPGLHAVPGVGYITDSSQDRELWIGAVTDPVEQMLEWLYLIDGRAGQVHVYVATVHRRWLPHSKHHLDPGEAEAVLGCGGHRQEGHEWQPAKVRWEGYAPIWDAEVCVGAHLGGQWVPAEFRPAECPSWAGQYLGQRSRALYLARRLPPVTRVHDRYVTHARRPIGRLWDSSR